MDLSSSESWYTCRPGLSCKSPGTSGKCSFLGAQVTFTSRQFQGLEGAVANGPGYFQDLHVRFNTS